MTEASRIAQDSPHRQALVSIIVVTYNCKAFLARQMAALAVQTEKRWSLIVVDNASRPKERPRPSDLPPYAQFIQLETNIGFAGANNRAAADVQTPFIACLNPDAFPEPDWLDQLLLASARWPDAACFGSTQISDADPAQLDGGGDETFFLGFFYRALHRRPISENRPEGPCFSACAAGALYRTEDFKSAGGFDERFFCYGEDVDLGYRLRLRGRASVQAERAVIYHIGGATGSSAFADYHGARNRIWTFIRCTPPVLFCITAPLHAAMTLAILFWHLISGRGLASWRGAWDGVRRAPEFWRERQSIQKARQVTSADIARAMIWSPFALPLRKPKRIPRRAAER